MSIKVDNYEQPYTNLTVARGFKIDYTSSYDGCGGILTGYKGNIYSTPYPEAYPANMRCRWQIGKT